MRYDPTSVLNVDTFEPFSPLHLAVVLVTVIIIAAVVVLGLRWRDTTRQRPLELALGLTALGVWIIANGYYLLPGPYTVVQRLPLHITDLLGLVAPAAMLWPHLGVLRAVLY